MIRLFEHTPSFSPGARAAAFLSVALLAACASTEPRPGPSWQAPRVFDVPLAGAFPNDPAVAPDGTVWFTDRVNDRIGRFDLEQSIFQFYPTSRAKSGPYGIAVDSTGIVWYAASRRSLIGRLEPATGEVREIDVPGRGGGPNTLALSDGRLWFTMRGRGAYGYVELATEQVRLFDTPVARGEPYAIAADGRGGVWMTLSRANRILRVDEATGETRAYDLPGRFGEPRRIAVGPDGAVWYTHFNRGTVGRLDPRSGEVREYRSPRTHAEPYAIAVGRDGSVWYSESGLNLVVLLDPRTGAQQTIAMPVEGAARIRAMALDPRRARLWLPLSDAGKMAVIPLRRPGPQRPSSASRR